jgi:hypothetical protein
MYASQTAADGSSNLQPAATGAGGAALQGSGSSGGGAPGHSPAVEVLEAWNSRVSSSRKTKTVRQKWQELLLTVGGESAVSQQREVGPPTEIGKSIHTCCNTFLLVYWSLQHEQGEGGRRGGGS